MKNLIIIGASGFGREVHTWACDHPRSYAGEWCFKGFLDTRKDLLNGYSLNANQLAGAIPASSEARARFSREAGIIGDPMTYQPERDDVFICAVGDPVSRRRYATPVLEKGGEFLSLIHAHALVSAFVSIGRGVIVGPYAAISPDVVIGDFVAINSYTGVGHDVRIGDWCEVDGHCLIAGRAQIGVSVKIHAGAIITPDVTVGDGATIGAGSVVIGKVPAGITVFGNPARKFDWKA